MPLPRLLLALTAAGLILLPPAAGAVDLPRQLTFQGRLVRADGSPETAPQDLRFALYPTATGGAPLWEESHPGTPVTNGYYAVVLGTSAALSPTLLNGQTLYLGVSVVGQSELTPRLPVISVPYALRADDSNRLEGKDASDFASSGHTHPVVTTTTDGLMIAADKVKLNSAPNTYGSGLGLNSGTLSVNFSTSGGTNGNSTTVARSNHTHVLTCSYYTATGNTSATVSTAYCAANEVLTGGGCTDLEAAAAGEGISFGPSGVTTKPGSTPTGGPGYACSTHTSVAPTAYAICCRNMP